MVMSQPINLNGSCTPGKSVVISGVSGSFPRARHVKELSDILYNKENPISHNELRWDYNHPEVPQHVGLIPDLDKFDAQFFKVSYRLGVNMDPMSRTILEHTYQAIYDAGVNPQQLSGKKIGVYIGSCLSETEKIGLYTYGKTGLGIVGCNKSMFANRISYWLNIKGPSQAIDGGCCSSAVALEQACQAMAHGACDGAIVGGCNLCLHPQTSVHFGRNIKLCKDGKTKSYDKAADGCVKSEAINVLFLQRAEDALRIYAEVVSAKTAYSSLDNTGTFKRTPDEITRFLKEFYDGVKVSPRDVDYVEGFGAADLETDEAELVAIDNVFSPGRTEPLYVGSVMSNVGYCESASGVAAITKVLLGFHTGVLAGNLHYTQPRDDVEALRAGRLKILSDHKPAGLYVAVNGLSVTGVSSHVLLRGYYCAKDLSKYRSSIPRLVLISARTDSAVQNIINDLKSRPIDAEELALIQNIHSSKINGHLGKGFAVLDTDKESKTMSLCERAAYFDGGSRPLWFVYSGMGSQWTGMGAQLMRIPIFAAAIERCQRALEPKGIDIVHIITSPDESIYNNILHSFVGIAAVQIGLTDILLQLGLVPDKIIGHSVGELGCAYADGCLTAEEMILSAYSRGLVSIQTPFIRGAMAAVGIGFEQVSTMCPPEIEVACHNSPDSCTLSGPADAMTQFVAQLTADGIFAKEVPCSNIAYHSRYIAEAGPGLLKYLKEVIKTPRLRSERWVSTSVPQERWGEEMAKYSSAEYHTNNLLNSVLFEETSQLIPRDAVLVEVAPHGLLQAILKRAMPSCTHVPLTRRKHPDNARMLLEAIGQLFMEGYYPDIRHLYPKVEFPVSTGTPHLSPLVEWVHQEKWDLAQYASAVRTSAATCTFKITLHDDEYAYLRGHRVGGKTVFPFAAALVCAWDTLAMVAGVPRRVTSITFNQVELYSQPILHDSRLLRLTVSLHRGTGRFEIDDGITKVASGYITLKKSAPSSITDSEEDSKEDIKFGKKEIYQILNEKGHMYRDEFQGIREANASITDGLVTWTGRWESFLDTILQFNALQEYALQDYALSHDARDERVQPSFIREISINTDLAKTVQVDTDLKVTINRIHDYTRCGAVTFKGIKFNRIAKSGQRSLVFDTKLEPRLRVGSELNGAETVNGKVLENGKALKNGNNSENGNFLGHGDVENFHSLQFVDAAALQDDSISVKVHFAGLNTRDLQTKGLLKDNTSEVGYGMDFSGIDKNGSRVMGLLPGGASRPSVRVRRELLWPVPAHWSLEDAATVPFAYAHALYCLAIRTPLAPQSTVLVGRGGGATGLAIIALALHCNCRLFVVVGGVDKKRVLLKIFPKLNADDIICCRNDNFVERVMPATNGRGCDYVICGRGDYKDKIQYMLAEGIRGGWVRPLPRVTYAAHEPARALRMLASGARGRVLLRVHDIEAQPEASLRCGGCQLLVSDDEGLALRLAGRLLRRGARALHFHLPRYSYRLNLAMQCWRKAGVNVVTSSEDLAQKECASNLLKQSLTLGPDQVDITEILPASYDDIVDATEQALQSQKPVVFARYSPERQDSLLQQIEEIAGIIISENTIDGQTLLDLGLAVDKVRVLWSYLKDKLNITISEEDISLLTVRKIREIERNFKESDLACVQGLSVFFPFVDSDELYATIDDVMMPTLTQSSDMRDDEFDASVACLYIVPGLQGLHQRYSTLCERLQLAAVVLQPGLDGPNESLQETTARYVKTFLKKKAATNQFYLLGHEIGVLSALEMAAALEDLGMTGTVFCLGGGPDEFVAELERQLRVACSDDKEATLQEEVARHMCALMGVASPQLDDALRDAQTWPLKVEASVRALRGRVTYSMQYARLLIEAAYARVTVALRRAPPAPRALRSRVVLLRSPGAGAGAPSALSLQRYSREPLVVHDLCAPLPHAADDLRAAAIINRYLDEETKQYFVNKNLCHTYLLNRDCFFEAN
ncbi:fatty acid synthase-like [Cydia strobilella]|uniref:fatty acid synthase-like n=1 Tax=Cydia strobilella TaxID=1100964 RepID=UPI003006CE90